MKRNLFYPITVFAILLAFGMELRADEFIMDPSTMTPADTGYYIGGIWKDTDGDGIPDTFYNECVDEYSGSSHNEAGTQQGFTYMKAMIMPTCVAKGGTPIVATGYLQLARSWYLGTDSADMAAVICPAVTNMEELYMEVSPDVTPLDDRHIFYLIEYSKDGGTTWEPTFLRDESLSKDGDIKTYDGQTYLQIQEMIDASALGPIVIRIVTDPQDPSDGKTYPQRLKIHKIRITADAAPSATPVHPEQIEQYFEVRENTVIAKRGTITVFTTLGQLVGSGETLTLKSGIYIIRTQDGLTSKVLIK